MKILTLKLAAAGVRFLAIFARLFAGRGVDIVLISCQDDKPSQDILDLAAELKHIEAGSVCVMAGKMHRSFGGAFLFIGKLFSMLRYISRAKVVVIDAYCMSVSIPKKRPGQTVIQLWHAPEAIKKFSLQIVDTPDGYDSKTAEILCMHKNYDYILCPADATLPFFSEAFGYPESSFVKLGLPSLDRLGKRTISLNGKEISLVIARNDSDEAIHKITIVYAPTFRDGSVVDSAGLIQAFEKNMPGAELVLKLHPRDMGQSVGLTEKSHLVLPSTNWYSAADVIITDYSGVAVEAAAAGVASYYYIYDIDDYKARRGLNVDLREEAIGKYAFTDAGELAEQVANDFYGECLYDYNALAAFADKYLEVPSTGNTQKLASFISGLA